MIVLLALFAVVYSALLTTPACVDEFHYANGELVANGFWVSTSADGFDTPGPTVTAAQAVTTTHGAVRKLAAAVNLPTMTTGTYFVSFLISVTAGQDGCTEALTMVKGVTSPVGLRFHFAISSGTTVTFGLHKNGVNTCDQDGGRANGKSVSFGVQAHIVVAYEFSTGRASLWVNPTSSSSSPDVIVTPSGSGTQANVQVDGVFLRQRTLIPVSGPVTTPAVAVWDRFVAADSFADVVALDKPGCAAAVVTWGTYRK
jgi:hypothetical protein